MLNSIALVMLLSVPGGLTNDLLAGVDAADYFKSRSIQVNAKQMIAVASKPPTDGKSGIQQLLAIRWLGEQQEKTARDALQQIADGKLAQDPQGFAKDYAQAALARIDGKAVPLPKTPENSVRQALEWFPEDVTFFGALDGRDALANIPIDGKEIREQFSKLLPEDAKQEMYKFIEAVGNIRVDRIAFALTDGQGGQPMKIYMRLTGKADAKRLAEFIRKESFQGNVEERKADNVLVITHQGMGDNPMFAIVGDTDLIIAGYERAGKHIELIDEVLQVRAGRKIGLVGDKSSNPFGRFLKNTPANASGVLLGQLPAELRRDMQGPPIGAAPLSVAAHVIVGKEVNFQFQASMENATQATALVLGVGKAKQEALAGLKMIPEGIIKPEAIKTMTKMVENFKVEAKEGTVTGGLKLSSDDVKALEEILRGLFGVAAQFG